MSADMALRERALAHAAPLAKDVRELLTIADTILAWFAKSAAGTPAADTESGAVAAVDTPSRPAAIEAEPPTAAPEPVLKRKSGAPLRWSSQMLAALIADYMSDMPALTVARLHGISKSHLYNMAHERGWHRPARKPGGNMLPAESVTMIKALTRAGGSSRHVSKATGHGIRTVQRHARQARKEIDGGEEGLALPQRSDGLLRASTDAESLACQAQDCDPKPVFKPGPSIFTSTTIDTPGPSILPATSGLPFSRPSIPPATDANAWLLPRRAIVIAEWKRGASFKDIAAAATAAGYRTTPGQIVAAVAQLGLTNDSDRAAARKITDVVD